MKWLLFNNLIVLMIATFIFSCKKEPIAISTSGINLSKKSLTINVNATDTLKVTISPNNATNQKVSWISSDTTIVTVTSFGIIRGVKPGSAIIVITTDDGNKTDTCAVTTLKWINYSVPYANQPFHKNDVECSIIDINGDIWCGSEFNGVSKFNGSYWTTFDMNDGYIRSILIDAQNNKWFTTYGMGVFKFDGVRWTTYDTINTNKGLSNNDTYCIAIDSKSNKWIGTFSGVSKFDGTNWTKYLQTYYNGISNWVTSIAVDKQDNVWVGTEWNGVSKFNGTNWITYTPYNSGLLSSNVNAIAVDDSGNIWFGSNGYSGGVSKFDGVNWTTYTTENSGLVSNYIHSIAIDNHGNKWFCAIDALSRFDDKNWTTIKCYANIGRPVLINNISVDVSGNKWLSTENFGIFELTDYVNY